MRRYYENIEHRLTWTESGPFGKLRRLFLASGDRGLLFTSRHSNPIHGLLAVALAAFLLATGCAWNLSRLNLDRLRDDRAVEMDGRLSAKTPIVENPFQQPKSAK